MRAFLASDRFPAQLLRVRDHGGVRWRRENEEVDWPFNVTVLSGVVGPGPVDLSHRREIVPGRSAPMGEFAFDRLQAHGVVVVLDDLGLDSAWSEFDDCVFRQSRRAASDGTEPQGNLGFRPTVYRGCVFEGVRFRSRAGFSVGRSRFEACTFRRCRFECWRHRCLSTRWHRLLGPGRHRSVGIDHQL